MDIAISRAAPLRAGLASVPMLRALALPLLRQLDRPITVQHAYTAMPLHLLSYTHKGYWYYGRAREALVMQRISELVRPGHTVIEAGGHIGYVAQYLSSLVGKDGRVHVFEPGSGNTQFLKKNISGLSNALHIKAALSDHAGRQVFYEENIGGFMNSLDPKFASDSVQGRRRAAELRITQHTVATMRLDDYTLRHGVIPDFLKIDVEGSELAVLQGAEGTLRQTPALMVEVTRNKAEVYSLLRDHRFSLSTENGQPIVDAQALEGNVFARRENSSGIAGGDQQI